MRKGRIFSPPYCSIVCIRQSHNGAKQSTHRQSRGKGSRENIAIDIAVTGKTPKQYDRHYFHRHC
jgi:phage terminase large subunit